MIDFDRALRRLAAEYTGQGYTVVVDPRGDDLPPFARTFRLQLCCRRGAGGVVVAAYPDREAMSLDTRVSSYAEATAREPDWRFDLAILGPVTSQTRVTAGNALELTAEQVEHAAELAERAAASGFAVAALLAAWGTLEAAARLWLRATGRFIAPVGTPWRDLATDLYTEAAISRDEYDRLTVLAQWRNQTAHGLVQPAVREDGVQFVTGLARRLVAEAAAPAVATAGT